MNTEKIANVKKQMKLQSWQMQIEEQQNSGLNPTAWCKANNVNVSTFFTRLKKVRANAIANSTELQSLATTPINTLTKIVPSELLKESATSFDNASIKLSFKDITIEVNENSSMSQLSNILTVIGSL